MMKSKMRRRQSKLAKFLACMMIVSTFLDFFTPLVGATGITPYKINFTPTFKVNGAAVDINQNVVLKPGMKVDFSLDYNVDNMDPIPEEGDTFEFIYPSVFANITPEYSKQHFKSADVITSENGVTKVVLTAGPDIDTAIGGYLNVSAIVSSVSVEVPGDIIVDVDGEEIKVETDVRPPDATDVLIDKKIKGSNNDHVINPNNQGSIIGQEVPYSISLNEQYTKMNNAVLTDQIPDGMELVEGSLVVKKYSYETGSLVETTVPKNQYTVRSTKPLVIDFGDINTRHSVHYKLVVKEEKDSYVNTATITSNTTEKESDSMSAKPKPDTPSSEHDLTKKLTTSGGLVPNPNGSFVGKELEYEIIVNGNKTDKTNVVFSDTIPAGMELVESSIVVYKEERNTTVDVTDKVTIDTKKNPFTIKFGDISTQYRIVYKTKITEDKEEYINDALLTWDGGREESSSTAKPTPPTPGKGTISKKVEGKDSVTVKPDSEGSIIGKVLDYSILVNNELTEKKDLTLTDQLPAGMEYVEGSLKIFKNVGMDGNKLVYKDVTEEVAHSITEPAPEKITVNFGDTKDRYKVEYKTKIVEHKTEYVNDAELTWKGGSANDDATVKPGGESGVGGNDLIKKILSDGAKDQITIAPDNNGNYDRDINYRITVNQNFEQKNNAVLVDTFPEGMHYKNDSIKIMEYDRYGNGKNVTQKFIKENRIDIGENNETLTIKFGDINKRYVVTYTGRITDYNPDGWKNDANLTWDNGYKEDDTIVNPSEPEPGKGSLSKSTGGKDEVTLVPDETGSYIGQTLDYEIIVNDELTDKTNLTLSDTIPSGMKLLTNTLKVFRDVGNGKYEDITDRTDLITITKTEGTFTVKFGNTDLRYKVMYETEVTENKDSYVNNAVVTWNGGTESSTSTANPSEPKPGTGDELIKKVNGKDNITLKPTGSNFIGTKVNYSVIVNNKLLEKNNVVLTDPMPTGMKVVPNSVKIFKDYGGGVYGEVTDEFTIEYVENGFKINFGKITDRYKVTYKGEITEIIDTGYINVVTLTSKGNNDQEADGIVNIDTSDLDPGDEDKVISKASEEGQVISAIGDKVKYTVTLNPEKNRLFNLVFTDNIPEGMKFIENNFKVTEHTDKNETIDRSDIEKTYKNGILTIDFGDTYSKFVIEYYTEVTALKDTYENKAKATAKDVNVEVSDKVDYEIAAGGINGLKTANKTEVSLDKDDQEVIYTIKFWSDAVFPAGYLNVIDDLDDRLLVEPNDIIVPDYMNVTFNEDTKEVIITNTKDIPPSTKEKPIEIKIPVSFENVEAGSTVTNVAKINDATPPPVVVEKGYKFETIKVDADTSEALAGVTFDLYKVEQSTLFGVVPLGTKEVLIANDLVSDATGKISYELAEPGDYILRETDALPGYAQIGDVKFTIEKESQGTVVTLPHIENELFTGGVKLQKVDENNELLDGAIFKIEVQKNGEWVTATDKDGKVLENLTTVDGVLEVNNLLPNHYRFVETKAPSGYILNQEPKEFTIVFNQVADVEVSFENVKKSSASVEVEADKVLTGKPLKADEFTFELVDNRTNKVIDTATNDADGNIKFKALTFDQIGEYSYTVREKIENKPGISYDTKTFEVKITVAEEETGYVASIEYPKDGIVFNNEYSTEKTSAIIEANKTLTGKPLEAEAFAFELLDSKGTVLQTVKNDASGRIVFDAIEYLEVGDYNYKVREVKGQKPGVVYDAKVFDVVVKVKDENAELVAEVVYQNGEEATFNNQYVVTETSAVIEANKTLTGKDLEAGEFTFELLDSEGAVLQTVTNDANGHIVFDEIMYQSAGIYTYTVRESQENKKPGITYDNEEFEVTVTVVDKNAQLEANITYPKPGIVFENSYNPADTSVVLEANKTLSGKDLVAGQFNFEVLDKDKNVVATGTNNAEGVVTFSKINFDEVGVYKYTVKEVNGKEAGVTYDDKVFDVTVTVVDKNAQLEASVTYPKPGIVFENSYNPADTSVALEANKTLSGKDLVAGQFNFEVLDKDKNIVATGTNNAEGVVTFSKIDFDKVGTYQYTVKEVSGKEAGVTYDDTVFDVTVTVVDKNAQLEASVTYPKPGIVFENSYNPADTSVVLEANKTLSGKDLVAGQFNFEVLDKDKNVVATGTNNVEGVVTFSKINFDEVGVYTYTVKEVKGEEAGIIYDDTIFTVTVEVIDKDAKLEAAVTYVGGEPTFENEYDPTKTSAVIEAIKTLTGKALKAETFAFELLDSNGTVIQTVTNDANGRIVFDAIEYLEAGEYTYKVREVIGEEPGIIYDAKVFDVTVKVTDQNAQLVAKVVYPDAGVIFKNKYQPEKTVAVLEANKTLTGKELEAGDFTFELLDSQGNVIQTVTNDKEGHINFEELEYTKVGEYHYTIRESQKDKQPGIVYDETAFDVVVHVEDNNAKLEADVEYPNDKPTFKNEYNPKETTAVFEATKTLTGKNLEAGEFTFEVLDFEGNRVSIASNDEEGKIVFDELTYTKAGTYHYTIKEVIDNQKGILYDGSSKRVDVKVVDENASLKAEVIYPGRGMTFANIYVPDPIYVTLEASKTLVGQDLETGQFNFVVLDNQDNIVSEGTNDEFGNIKFEPIKFTENGTHHYTIREVEDDKQPGFVYDKSEFQVTVHIDAPNGDLVPEVIYQDKDVTFTNTLKTGSAQLIKVDADNNEAPIKGAEFKVVDEAGNVVRENLTSNEEGKVVVSDLQPGQYFFIETKAAPGYVLDETPIPFEIKFNPSEVVTVKFENKQITGSAELIKVDADNNEAPIENVIFNVIDEDGNVIRENLTTNKEGKIVVSDLLPGQYFFVEVKAADGYVLDETKIPFEISFNPTDIITIKFANGRETGSAELIKVDADNNQAPISGAEFKLVDANGEVIAENLVSDANGRITVDNLKPGTYYFIETKAAPGYVLDETPVEVTVDFNPQIVYQVKFSNEQVSGGAELLKVDADSKEVLAGAQFKLVDAAGTTIIENLVTDANGKIVVENLKPGQYAFVETKPAFGYELNSEPLKFEVIFNQVAPVQLTFENELSLGGATLVKVDEETDNTLANAEFKLYQKDGTELGTYVTDESGQINFENLKPGEYYVVEVKAPKGYKLDSTPIHFVIEKGQQTAIQIVVENEKLTDVPVTGVNGVLTVSGMLLLAVGSLVAMKSRKK